jgi:hypothetical protein
MEDQEALHLPEAAAQYRHIVWHSHNAEHVGTVRKHPSRQSKTAGLVLASKWNYEFSAARFSHAHLSASPLVIVIMLLKSRIVLLVKEW